MKKIGIINYQYSCSNYGAVLQAAALHWYIDKTFTVECEHINYIPSRKKTSQLRKFKVFIGDFLRYIGVKKQTIKHDSFKNSYVFEDFRKAWLPRSPIVYSSLEQLKSSELAYDYVIVGSDQVWRPSYTEDSTMVYFLSFVGDSVKRIAYAASFGNDHWECSADDELTRFTRLELDKFSAISVREDSGINVCKEVFGCEDISHVLDPTLLAGKEFFDQILAESDEFLEEKVVYYKLELDEKFTSFVSSLCEQFNLASENIYYKDLKRSYYYESVENWVNKIKNGKVIVTDSFHCICLAIIYEKDFLYYPNDNRGLSRLESLLKMLEIKDRIYIDTEVNPIEYYASLDKIDYTRVNSLLESLRVQSGEYLENALSS